MLLKVCGISGLLASVCLISALAGTAAFAQDAVVDVATAEEAVVEEVAVEEAAVEEAVVAVEPIAIPAEELAPAVQPAAIDFEDESFGDYSDDELADAAENSQHGIDYYFEQIEYVTEHGGEGPGHLEYLLEELAYQESRLGAINAEITRRLPVEAHVKVVAKAEPDVLPAPAAKPSPEFCAALVASGNYSDCGWAFTQSQ